MSIDGEAASRPSLRTRMFSAFEVRNYRIYFAGQVVSVSGLWMQRVAQSWLVLDLTDSGVAVGTVTALQFLPHLVLAPIGGVAADRFDKRRVLIATRALSASIAGLLGALVLTGAVELWMVYGLAFLGGLVASFANPSRNAFVMEMVGRSRLTNAVGLNSMLINAARVVGPAIGGVLIVTVGIGLCFVFNAVSYLFAIAALVAMRTGELEIPGRAPRLRGQLREAWNGARSTPSLMVPLVMSAVVGIFAWEFEVVLPLLAKFTYGQDADTFGTMFAAMGVGAAIGGLSVASQETTRSSVLAWSVLGLGVSMAAVAAAPTLAITYLLLPLTGASGAAFLSLGNSALQLNAPPEMRGRVASMRAMAVLGTRPIGAPLMGWVGEQLGARAALGIGGAAAFGVGLWAWARVRPEIDARE
jgi:MFS family permease